MNAKPSEPKPTGRNKAPTALWGVAGVFVVLGAGFAFGLFGKIEPIAWNDPVDLKYVQKKTLRDPLMEGMKLKKAGFEYNCNSCHQHFDLTGLRGRRVAEHMGIKLDHGTNDRCLNCHHSGNLEAFVNHDGSEIDATQSIELCRKCHGPKYRDWVAGVHGRPNGYWDQGRGPSVKAMCVACHDPHSPQFKPVEPAPAPRDRRGPTGRETQHES